MKITSIRPVIWIPIVVVLMGSMLGWASWASLGVSKATPMEKFTQHQKENNDQFNEIQQTLYNKLDAIRDTILDLHKK